MTSCANWISNQYGFRGNEGKDSASIINTLSFLKTQDSIFQIAVIYCMMLEKNTYLWVLSPAFVSFTYVRYNFHRSILRILTRLRWKSYLNEEKKKFIVTIKLKLFLANILVLRTRILTTILTTLRL